MAVVYLDDARRGAACAAALVVGEELGRAGLPVFLYGELAGGRSRAALRKDGLSTLTERIARHELQPDFGPTTPDPRTGATLVAARAPLVAFNLELAPPATLDDARAIAALIREGGEEGLPGVRAIGIELSAHTTPPPKSPPTSRTTAARRWRSSSRRSAGMPPSPVASLSGSPRSPRSTAFRWTCPWPTAAPSRTL